MRAALALAMCTFCACSVSTVEIDPFPITVDLADGVPIMTGTVAGLDDQRRTIVIDTGSPLTMLDDGTGGVSRRRVTVTLFEPSDVPRARFMAVLSLLTPVGSVGEGSPRDVQGVLGGDVLSRVALRLDPSHDEIRFFPDIAGEDPAHEDSCESVFPTPPAGRGNFHLGEEDIILLPTRMVVGACLSPATADCITAGEASACDGADGLFLLSTGIKPTLLGRSAYRRATGASDADIDALPKTQLYLVGEPNGVFEEVPVGQLSALALAAQEASDRGPCEELRTSRVMAHGGCGMDISICPCSPETACAAGASVELGGPIDVVILEDTHPLLQSLRNELRPQVADIDGLLGMDAIGRLITDVDYPNSRLIFRCAEGATGCLGRPRISDLDRRAVLAGEGCLP